MARVMPRLRMPNQMDGPLRRARAAQTAVWLGFALLKKPTVKTRKVMARMGLAA